MRTIGASASVGLSASAGVIGSVIRANPSSTECRIACRRHVNRLTMKCAYRYPPSSISWKNSRAVVHTPGVEPNHGRMYLPMIGWTWNSRNALRNTVTASNATEPPVRACRPIAIGSAAGFMSTSHVSSVAGGPGGWSNRLVPVSERRPSETSGLRFARARHRALLDAARSRRYANRLPRLLGRARAHDLPIMSRLLQPTALRVRGQKRLPTRSSAPPTAAGVGSRLVATATGFSARRRSLHAPPPSVRRRRARTLATESQECSVSAHEVGFHLAKPIRRESGRHPDRVRSGAGRPCVPTARRPHPRREGRFASGARAGRCRRCRNAAVGHELA